MESRGFFMPITRVVVVAGHSSCMFTEYEDVPVLPIPSGINVITLCSLNDVLSVADNAPFRGLETLMSNPGVTVTLGDVVELFKEKRKLRVIGPETETSFGSIGVAYSGEQGTPQFFFGGMPNIQLADEGIFCWDGGGGMTDISLDLLTENKGLSLLTPLQMEFMKLERAGVIREPLNPRESCESLMKFREAQNQSSVDVGVENIKMFFDEYKILNDYRINYLESIGFNRNQAADYVEENKMDLPIYYLEQIRKNILRWEKRNQKFVFENIEEFIHSESERMFVELELEELGGVTEENIRKYIMFLSESTMNQMNRMKKRSETYGYFGGDFRLVPPRFREIESGVLLELLHKKYPEGNTAVVYVGCRTCRNKDGPPCQSPRGAKCRVGGGKLRRRRIKKTMKKKQIRNRCKKKGKTFKK